LTPADSFSSAQDHLDATVAAGSAFYYSLRDFRAGDSDTGQGDQLQHALNITSASLDGSKHLTGAFFLAFFTNSPNSRPISITGNDRVRGELKGLALDELQEKSDLGRKLEEMRLTNQTVIDKKLEIAIKNLSAARK
jgi:hypothetical protein